MYLVYIYKVIKVNKNMFVYEINLKKKSKLKSEILISLFQTDSFFIIVENSSNEISPSPFSSTCFIISLTTSVLKF